MNGFLQFFLFSKISKWPLPLLTLWLVLDLNASSAEEGFFKPDQIVSPFDVVPKNEGDIMRFLPLGRAGSMNIDLSD